MKLQTLFFAAIIILAGYSARGDTASQQRISIQKMRSKTLSKLYILRPEAHSDTQHAGGCAVFASSSNKILLFGFGSGYSAVQNKAIGKGTYVKMAQGGTDLGMGVEQQRMVLAFRDKAALETFIRQRYMVGTDVNVVIKYGGKDVAPITASTNGVVLDTTSLPPKVSVYDLTEKGLAAQTTIDGYKYWSDAALNPQLSVGAPSPVQAFPDPTLRNSAFSDRGRRSPGSR